MQYSYPTIRLMFLAAADAAFTPLRPAEREIVEANNYPFTLREDTADLATSRRLTVRLAGLAHHEPGQIWYVYAVELSAGYPLPGAELFVSCAVTVQARREAVGRHPSPAQLIAYEKAMRPAVYRVGGGLTGLNAVTTASGILLRLQPSFATTIYPVRNDEAETRARFQTAFAGLAEAVAEINRLAAEIFI